MQLQSTLPTTLSGRTAPRGTAFNRPADIPAASSMRVMETGLALIAIAVALLLNLGR